MSFFFNSLPSDVSRALNEYARRARPAQEQFAIAALERGLAFEDEAQHSEDVQPDDALKALASLDRGRN